MSPRGPRVKGFFLILALAGDGGTFKRGGGLVFRSLRYTLEGDYETPAVSSFDLFSQLDTIASPGA